MTAGKKERYLSRVQISLVRPAVIDRRYRESARHLRRVALYKCMAGPSSLQQRATEICRALAATYPDAHCELNFRNPLELLVATMLSAQCTDVQVNKVTADVFKKYKAAGDYARADPAELEHDLMRIGLYRAKAKNIRAMAQILVEKHGGQVPRTMEELTELPGVGRKTANVVLGNAFDINVGVVVDTHVARLSQRLGLTRQTDPKKIEPVLMKLVPQDKWTIFSHWLIFHGRRVCKALRPACPDCPIAKLCPSYPKFMKLYAKKAR
jgi:endonuclease III